MLTGSIPFEQYIPITGPFSQFQIGGGVVLYGVDSSGATASNGAYHLIPVQVSADGLIVDTELNFSGSISASIDNIKIAQDYAGLLTRLRTNANGDQFVILSQSIMTQSVNIENYNNLTASVVNSPGTYLTASILPNSYVTASVINGVGTYLTASTMQGSVTTASISNQAGTYVTASILPNSYITASISNYNQLTASISNYNLLTASISNTPTVQLQGVTTSSFLSQSADKEIRNVKVDQYGNIHVVNENCDALPSNFVSPSDFSASFMAGNIVGISGSSFTVADTVCNISYIQWYSSGSQVKTIINGQAGYTLSAASNLITCKHPSETSWFSNTDLWYRVGIRYQEKAYTPSTDVYRQQEINPISDQYLNEIWVSSSNVAAGINHYPSIGGVNCGGYKSVSIHFYISSSGNFTLTVSGSNEVNTAYPSWMFANVTPSGLNLCTNTTSGSYDSGAGILSGVLQYKDLNMDRIRVDLSGSSATNFYMIAVRRIY